jgi:hypothetical protein
VNIAPNRIARPRTSASRALALGQKIEQCLVEARAVAVGLVAVQQRQPQIDPFGMVRPPRLARVALSKQTSAR